MATVLIFIPLAAGCSSSGHSGGSHSTSSVLPAPTTQTTAETTPTVAPVTTATPSSGTRILYAAPVDVGGHPRPGLPVSSNVSGHCESGSDSIGNVEVYRCGAGDYIYDPCWFDADGGVLCMASPWDTSVVHIAVPGIPTGVNVGSTDLNYPWGVQLSSGARCLAVQGAHDQFESKTVDYSCTGGSITGLSLLRGVNRSTQYWNYQTVIYNGSNQAAGPVVSVASAWFAGPPPTGAPACQGSSLSVTATVSTPSAGMAWIVFENSSTSSCRLYGYPGVAVLDSSGNQVLQVSRTPGAQGSPPPDVVVPADGTASAVLRGNPDYPSGSCPSYQQLLVTPPNTTASRKIAVDNLVICANAQIDPVGVGGSPLFS